MRRTEGGGATVELTLVTPLLLIFLLLVVAGGRLVSERMEVDDVAHNAARAASIERNPESAVVAANQVVGQSNCRDAQVTIDTSSFQAGGSVSIDVTCSVDLSNLTLLHLAGSREVHARASEPIDMFRGTT